MVAIPGVSHRPLNVVASMQGTVADRAATASTASPPSLDRLSGSDSSEPSGHSIMVSRLFSGTPESVTYTPTNKPSSGSSYNFLTTSDKAIVASLYD